MKTKQLIIAASFAALCSSAMAHEAVTTSEWLMDLKNAAGHSLSFQYRGECTDEEFASLPHWKTIKCRGVGTGLSLCQDKTFTISIDSQLAYCHVDVELTAQAQTRMKKNLSKIKLPPGCYFIRDGACTVCNPPNIAEGCGAGYTQADLKAWEREEAKLFGWEHVRKLEGKDK
jgi:hypothetical protein